MVAGRGALSALCIAASLLVANSARADEKSTRAATAQQLFDEALKLMDSRSYGEACPKLARSQELAPSGGTLLNLGDCYEKNGQSASAWVSFRDAAARAASAGQKSAQASALARADALAPKLLHLTLTLAGARVPGLEIRRDGQLVSNAELGIDVPVDPGPHKIEATAPGYVTWTKDITLVIGTPAESIAIPALGPVPTAPRAEPGPAPPAGPQTGNKQRMIGLVVAGGGVVAVGIGAVFGLKAMSTNDDALSHCRDAGGTKRCDPTGLSLTEDARSQALVSTVLVVLGAAAGAGGAVLYLIAPRAEPSGSALRVTPYATATSAGLGLHAAW